MYLPRAEISLGIPWSVDSPANLLKIDAFVAGSVVCVSNTWNKKFQEYS